MNKLAVSELTGALAVGSIIFCGIFLIVDGVNGLYVLVEQYAQGAVWAIVFAIPVLVISYALGIVAIQATSYFRWRYDKQRGFDAIGCFVAIAKLNHTALTSRYQDLRVHQDFLQGCVPAFVVLGVGFLFSIRWMGTYQLFGWFAALGCFALAATVLPLANRIASEADQLGVWALTEITKQGDTKQPDGRRSSPPGR